MESGRKLRGFKDRLVMSFNQALKPSVKYATKVKPAPPYLAVDSPDSLGFSAKNEFVRSSTKPKAPSVKKEAEGDQGSYADGANGGDHLAEVDKRAATYISYVKERFRLERVDDDGGKH